MSRIKWTYTLPAAIAAALDTKSVTLVELTAGEEMMATKRAMNDPIRLAWEMPKESLRAVNGVELSAADGSIDEAWETMHPKARSFVMAAYNQLHNPAQDDISVFLQSRQAEVV